MKIGWVGFHAEGIPALRGVLEHGQRIEAVFTLKKSLAAKRSGAADYASVCTGFGVPLFEIRGINDAESLRRLKELALDVVFVIGWTQLVRSPALRSVRLGMIGAHASLLPHDRGRAPINWALIRGAAQTGNTLFWLNDEIDSGDIIDQVVIPISPYDTCASLYDRVARSNREMILRLLPKLCAGERPGRTQARTDEPDLPARRPQDGLLHWSMENVQVYNFCRALTQPYPGAFSWLDGQRWRIWNSALLPNGHSETARPGQVLGSVQSPEPSACGQVVACGNGSVVLLELENDDGEVLRGFQLSDQRWTGKVWKHEHK